MSTKLLKSKFPDAVITKTLFKPYDYKITQNEKDYHVLVLNVNSNNILSFNSKYVWEIRSGKAVGINFKTSSTKRLDMREFNALSNKIVVLKNQPYKILKYINESEVIDISSERQIYDVSIYRKFEDIILK